MDVTPDMLVTMLGRKQIEIEMLREHNRELASKVRRLEEAAVSKTEETTEDGG